MLGYAVDLLSNASATGSSTRWPGGRAILAVSGTFGTNVLKLEIPDPSGSGWLALPDVSGTAISMSAAGAKLVDLPEGPIRASLTGGAGSSAMYARLMRAPCT